jgi:hypothetical protein
VIGDEEIARDNRLAKDLRNLFYSLLLRAAAGERPGASRPTSFLRALHAFNTSGVEIGAPPRRAAGAPR